MSYQQPYGQQPYGQQQQQPGYNPNYGGNQGYGSQAPPPPPGWAPPPAMPHYMPTANDAEAAGTGYAGNEGPFKYSLHFNERTIRIAFIRKVFTLVTMMLAVVAVITALPFMHSGIQSFVRNNMGFYYVSYGAFLVTYITLVCCESVRRSFPANIIITGIFTVATGWMTMCLTQQFNVESVLLALIITTVCCGTIIIFSMQTKYDFTNCMGVMIMLSLFFMVFGIIAIIGTLVFHVRWLYTIYAGFGALMFMAYLAIDVQMLMGGRKYEISPEDHIFAAVQLFLDIVYIFWFILSLFGSRDSDQSRATGA